VVGDDFFIDLVDINVGSAWEKFIAIDCQKENNINTINLKHLLSNQSSWLLEMLAINCNTSLVDYLMHYKIWVNEICGDDVMILL